MTTLDTIHITRFITTELESKLLKLVVGNRDIAYTVHVGVLNTIFIRLVRNNKYVVSASGNTFGSALLDLYRILRDSRYFV